MCQKEPSAVHVCASDLGFEIGDETVVYCNSYHQDRVEGRLSFVGVLPRLHNNYQAEFHETLLAVR